MTKENRTPGLGIATHYIPTRRQAGLQQGRRFGLEHIQSSQVFPVLSKVAKKIHFIVATSAESARVFCKCGNIVNEKRSRLKPSNLDKFVFLHAIMYKENEEAISLGLNCPVGHCRSLERDFWFFFVLSSLALHGAAGNVICTYGVCV